MFFLSTVTYSNLFAENYAPETLNFPSEPKAQFEIAAILRHARNKFCFSHKVHVLCNYHTGFEYSSNAIFLPAQTTRLKVLILVLSVVNENLYKPNMNSVLFFMPMTLVSRQ